MEKNEGENEEENPLFPELKIGHFFHQP